MDINGLLTQMLWKSSPADASAGPKNKINLQAKVACEQPRRPAQTCALPPCWRRTVTFPRSESRAAQSGQMKRVYLTFAGCLMSRSLPVPQSFRVNFYFALCSGTRSHSNTASSYSGVKNSYIPSQVAEVAIKKTTGCSKLSDRVELHTCSYKNEEFNM